MDNDSMTSASAEAAKSHLTAEDAEQLRKLIEQVWFGYSTTRDPILLTTHQELNTLRLKLTGEAE